MKKSIRDIIYLEDLKRASRQPIAEKLKLALQLSDFCRTLKRRALIKKRRYERA